MQMVSTCEYNAVYKFTVGQCTEKTKNKYS